MQFTTIKSNNILNSFEKAYVEGIYADTPHNRALNRVGERYSQPKEEIKKEDNKTTQSKSLTKSDISLSYKDQIEVYRKSTVSYHLPESGQDLPIIDKKNKSVIGYINKREVDQGIYLWDYSLTPDKVTHGDYNTQSEALEKFLNEYNQNKPSSNSFTKAHTSIEKITEFRQALDKMPKSLQPFLSKYTPEQYQQMGATVYLANNNEGGYAITKEGDIISVFSQPGKGLGRQLMEDAIKNGGITLDCIGGDDTKQGAHIGHLERFYSSLGFDIIRTEKWDDSYAPKNWDYETFGRPPILFFKLKSEIEKEKKQIKKELITKFPDLKPWDHAELLKYTTSINNFQKVGDKVVANIALIKHNHSLDYRTVEFKIAPKTGYIYAEIPGTDYQMGGIQWERLIGHYSSLYNKTGFSWNGTISAEDFKNKIINKLKSN